MPITTSKQVEQAQSFHRRPIWRNNTPSPNSIELDFQRDCTNSMDVIGTPSTILSSASTFRSKSFEEDMSRPCPINAECIAQEPTLVIPNLDQDTMTNSANSNLDANRSHSDNNQSPSVFRHMQMHPPPKLNPDNNQSMQSRAQSQPGTLTSGGSLSVSGHSVAHLKQRNPLTQAPAYYNTNANSNAIHRNTQANAIKPPTQALPHNVYIDNKNKSQWSNPSTRTTQIATSKGPRSQPSSQLFPASYPQISSQVSQSNVNIKERRQESSPTLATPHANIPVPVPSYRSQQNKNHAVQHSHGNGSYASKMQGNLIPNLTQSPRSPYHQFQHSKPGSRVRSASMSEHRPSSYPPKQSPASHSTWQHSHSQHQSYRNSAHSNGKNSMPGSPNTRHQHHPSSYSQYQASSGGSRSPPEVLKTLLRKKACLYEAGTSRAIALVTWLVGRNLALHDGYFSRQRLQAGVHAVVARKIDSGMITRTKVNRCMQIILNSCFHYIIPKPDGTEENGDAFCDSFKDTVVNDMHLLKSLLPPWNDLDVTQADKVTQQKELEVPLSPKGNGKGDGKKKGGSTSNPDPQTKRLVLLCFNENVRSAEDVLRCHNDFIRDAAITSNLHLTSDEWRYFFSRKDDDCSLTSCTLDSATSGGGAIQSSPQMRGAEGGDIPYLSFDIPAEVSDCIDFKDSVVSESKTKSTDVLGQMCGNELSKFRTTWCCKRYEHDARLCRFAHVNENRGWLRRDPNMFSYSDKLCPYTTVIKSDDPSLNGCHVNACKDGLLCKFAHSQEEVDYHLKHYKSKVCESAKGNARPCSLLDICPLSHPTYPGHHQRSGRRRTDSCSRKGGPKHTQGENGNDKYKVPGGSPMLYLTPAPNSEFEKSFQFPGLQGLFRRNSIVHYANHVGMKGGTFCLFGDNCGLQEPLFQLEDGGTNGFSLYSE